MLAPALFLALALAYFWPVPARLTTRMPHDPGDPLLNAWILWWNTQAVPFTERWWNAPAFYPTPGMLALSEHLFGIAVFTAPLQLAGLSAVGAYNIALILSAWLSGFFAYLLGRRLTGSALAGAIAGVAFALAPYRAAQLPHLQVLTSQWMPLMFLAMHAYLGDRRKRWLAVFAVAWLLQALSNGYYLLFLPVLVGLWLLWFIRWKQEPRPGLVLGGTFAAASVALLPALLKYREVHEALALVRHRSEMIGFSAEPASFFRVPEALTFWPSRFTLTEEGFLFPGVTPILLVLGAAAAALVARASIKAAIVRRSPLIFYSVATIAMWWLAMGPAPEEAPLQEAFVKPYTWLAFLPGFSGLRVPSRFAMLASLTLAVAAALAFHRLVPPRPRVRGAIAALALVGLFVDGWIDRVPTFAPPGRIMLPDVRDALVIELPLDTTTVATSAMYRQIDHGRPLVSGYSGHFPGYYRILTSALNREDPSALIPFAIARPLILVINHQYGANDWLVQYVRRLPGIVHHGGSSGGAVFVLPAQPRPRTGAIGAPLPVAQTTHLDREHTVLDLGEPQIVRAVGFNTRWHYEELAPRMEIEVSDDGERWTSVWLDWTAGLTVTAALEDPRLVPVRIPLPDVRGRYLRIHPVPRWMMGELTVFTGK